MKIGVDSQSEKTKKEFKKNSSDLIRYSTGAVRTVDAENVRYDLISPIALEAVAKISAEGCNKYGPFNWEKGMKHSGLINHGLRHLVRHLAGMRDEDHLAKAIWNFMAAYHSRVLWKELNKGEIRGEDGVPLAGDPSWGSDS